MRKSFLSILGLLITVMIMVFLSYLLLNAYLFKRPAASVTGKPLPQNANSVTQYKTIIDDTRSITGDINKRIRQQQEDIDAMLR